MAMTDAQITATITQKQTRLTAYLDREAYMLSTDGVQSYGIGTKNLRRYDTELSQIRAAIDQLEQEIKELSGQLAGGKPRKAVAVVPFY